MESSLSETGTRGIFPVPRRASVLIADDSDEAQELLHRVLFDAGYEVLQASNGREALGLVLDHPSPSLIIVDLLMPVMGGMELIDVLHSYRRLAQIPILVVSATEVPASARLPDTRYLTKPFTEAELLMGVEALVGGAIQERR